MWFCCLFQFRTIWANLFTNTDRAHVFCLLFRFYFAICVILMKTLFICHTLPWVEFTNSRIYNRNRVIKRNFLYFECVKPQFIRMAVILSRYSFFFFCFFFTTEINKINKTEERTEKRPMKLCVIRDNIIILFGSMGHHCLFFVSPLLLHSFFLLSLSQLFVHSESKFGSKCILFVTNFTHSTLN